jgi:hypothetical protein
MVGEEMRDKINGSWVRIRLIKQLERQSARDCIHIEENWLVELG